MPSKPTTPVSPAELYVLVDAYMTLRMPTLAHALINAVSTDLHRAQEREGAARRRAGDKERLEALTPEQREAELCKRRTARKQASRQRANNVSASVEAVQGPGTTGNTEQASALSYSPPEVTSALNIGYGDGTDGSSAPIPLPMQPADTTWQPPTHPENLQILISELGIEVTPQDPCQETGGFDMPSLDSDDGSIASALAFRPSACGDPDEWANPIELGEGKQFGQRNVAIKNLKRDLIVLMTETTLMLS
ncbi:hypothetical protein QAD02_011592 [Eretmocerus hayati]|uniref:Uncharacterized protein n=1 Tax=Eretmocerus hayati TaxID=131215 RepID=A0ACC2NYY2_9HYME|nr:hypothetical protein QAD02_011592 [Eretmocerus hayati]